MYVLKEKRILICLSLFQDLSEKVIDLEKLTKGHDLLLTEKDVTIKVKLVYIFGAQPK